MLNSKIYYSYCDASNYKAHNECVINGLLSDEQRQIILNCLYEGEFFVPGAVGLDVELPWEYDPQDDHPYWRLDEDSFEETTQCSTIDITADAFVRAFVENKDRWEQLGVEYSSDYVGSSVSADVQNIIDEAMNRCDVHLGRSDKDIELV